MSGKNQYERELEELLESLDVKLEQPSRAPIPFRRRRRSPFAPLGRALNRLRPRSPRQLMVISAIIFFGAFLLQLIWPALAPVMRPVAALGVVLLLIAYATHFLRPSVTVQRWRGQAIELPTHRPGWAVRLYRLIYRE